MPPRALSRRVAPHSGDCSVIGELDEKMDEPRSARPTPGTSAGLSHFGDQRQEKALPQAQPGFHDAKPVESPLHRERDSAVSSTGMSFESLPMADANGQTQTGSDSSQQQSLSSQQQSLSSQQQSLSSDPSSASENATSVRNSRPGSSSSVHFSSDSEVRQFEVSPTALARTPRGTCGQNRTIETTWSSSDRAAKEQALKKKLDISEEEHELRKELLDPSMRFRIRRYRVDLWNNPELSPMTKLMVLVIDSVYKTESAPEEQQRKIRDEVDRILQLQPAAVAIELASRAF